MSNEVMLIVGGFVVGACFIILLILIAVWLSDNERNNYAQGWNDSVRDNRDDR